MPLTQRHRKAAEALWKSGGHIDEAAKSAGVQPATLRRWLADPEFRVLLAEDALEPILQATSAMLRWAPAAVARLIEDLQGESAGDARQAAREILKLALDTQRELAGPADAASRRAAEASAGPPADDPLSRRMAALTDGQLQRVLEILNGSG